eukprot:Seg767.1 transcript_id=Seg767.1/GoldUCD/mRNA.D3Y31 product="hypothetical protein" pseudo=true protein_id=Seg767.1/GoldUCD/D3Y31
MTVKSLKTVSKGSNVNSADFTTAATKTSSTANDGLHDVGIKNISDVTRITSSTETVADNTVKLLGSMIVYDRSKIFKQTSLVFSAYYRPETRILNLT